jgi:Flp pilus assembly protein TadG
MKHLPARTQLPYKQHGAIATTFIFMLIPIIGFIGLAVDLTMAYGRRAELQGLADAAALAAARALDGTMAGIAAAKTKASQTAVQNRYAYGDSVVWNDAALSFSTRPDGAWISAAGVSAANVATLRYAQVDTRALGAEHGSVGLMFFQVVNSGAGVTVSARAVAGRDRTVVAPLAICALSTLETSSRPNALGAGNEELLEYGFRRGFGYNLLNLNLPNSAYAVNPVDFPPAANKHTSDADLMPFVCAGTLATPRVAADSELYVRKPFPAALIAELNSRFEIYSGGSSCDRKLAPPDFDLQDYRGTYSGWWMNPVPWPGLSPRIPGSAEPGLLVPGTVAATNASYGPLWSFATPVRYNGGDPFSTDDWKDLYPVDPGPQVASDYYSSQRPYAAHSERITPSATGVLNRRVLNVPLLACSAVTGDKATVLAIGQFLMTTPAEPDAIHAEFGGIVTDAKLAASAVLYQ